MRILCIINDRAGQSDISIYECIRAIGKSGSETVVRYLHGGTSLRDVTRDVPQFDRVIACGGDGTVTGVCYAMRGSGVPLLAYPAGTANLLAMNLRIPYDPRELAAITLGSETTPIDLCELSVGEVGAPDRRTEGFMIAAGAGFDASIMLAAQDLKPSIGVSAYLVGALANLMPTISRFRLILDGKTVETEGIAVLVANVARLQFDLPLIHASDPRDGLFEVIVLRTCNAFELIPAVWAAIIDRTTGQHADRTAGVETYVASHVRIEADPALPVQFDGELMASSTPFEARVLPEPALLLVSNKYFLVP